MVTYSDYKIVFQEVPGQISLAFSIMGCQNNCKGCHSPHLMRTDGVPLTKEEFVNIFNKYDGLVTCVLFLGGDQYTDELIELSSIARSLGCKVAFYSGKDEVKKELIKHFDYYKVGSYKEEFGGLDKPSTNQRLYKISDNKTTDITSLFWENKEDSL